MSVHIFPGSSITIFISNRTIKFYKEYATIKRIRYLLLSLLMLSGICGVMFTAASANAESISGESVIYTTNGYTEGPVYHNGKKYSCSIGVGFREGAGGFLRAACGANITVNINSMTAKYDTSRDGYQTGTIVPSKGTFSEKNTTIQSKYATNGLSVSVDKLLKLLSAEGTAVFHGDSPVSITVHFNNQVP